MTSSHYCFDVVYSIFKNITDYNNISTLRKVIVIDPDAEESNNSIKPLIIACSVIATIFLVPSIFIKSILGIVISIISILIVFITGLLINKHKYFKSKAWQNIIHTQEQKLKMVNALNKSIKLTQKECFFDITTNCSLQTLDNAKAYPFAAICTCFNIDDHDATIKWLNNLDHEYHIVIKEFNYMYSQKHLILKNLKHQVPFWIRCVTYDLNKYIFPDELIAKIKYPCYRFSYYSPTGGYYQTFEVILNIQNIQSFKEYIIQQKQA